MLKKILFPLFSLFLAYRTVALLNNLSKSSASDLVLSESLIVGGLLALFITGIFAFVGFAYPSNRILPNSYYRIQNPSRLRQVYRVLRVDLFKRFLLFMFWGKEDNRKRYFNGRSDGIAQFIYQTKQSEFGHAGAFLVILLVTLYLFFRGFWAMGVCLLILNLIGNFYPVVLQRHHRMRVEELKTRK